MGHRVAGIGLFQPSLNLGEEVQALHRVFDGCIGGQRFDRFNHALLYRLLCQLSLQNRGNLAREYGQVSIRSSRRLKRPSARVQRPAARRDPCFARGVTREWDRWNDEMDSSHNLIGIVVPKL